MAARERRSWHLRGALLAALACVAAAAGAGSAVSASPASIAPAQAVQPVTPHSFAGDVRRIPGVNRPAIEEKGQPKRPETRAPGPSVSDPAHQTVTPSAPAPGTTTNFAGLDFANWGAGWPPDTNGDVGGSYYVQTVNTSIGIFDKSTGSRAAAFTFNTLWSQAHSGTPCDTSNQGDPVALYDPIGDRYLVADFAWSNYSSGAMYECIAVSRTNNPVTGGWYFYAWQVETGGKLPDYPKLGVWPDGIYMSANVFATSGLGNFQNVQVWALNRQEMESGATAHGVTVNLPTQLNGVYVFSLLPSNARVVTGLPPQNAPNYFASIYGINAIRVWKFHVDYATPANSTFTGPTDAPVSAFNTAPGTAPELSGNGIDTLNDRLMMQNQYTNLGGTESLWLTHTVGNGGSPNIAQVRWYQLPVTGGVVASSPAQQSTWGPDSSHRFMPSLAVDKAGDMALGYSVSSSSMYPAIRYAGRLASDPPSTLGQGETTLVAGGGSQSGLCGSGTCTRWGDYSAMTIDPDGCTFWYTNEYYTATGLNWQTRIGSFSFPSCSGSTGGAPSVTTNAATSIGTTAGTLNGSANPNGLSTNAGFRWSATSGSCSGLANATSPTTAVGSDTSSHAFSFPLTGLTSLTTYYYCAFATNSSGTTYGAVLSFKTAGLPAVTTSAATSVGSTTATLNGSANPNGLSTSGWFVYSTSNAASCNGFPGTSTGTSGLGSGTSAASYSQPASGLIPSTTYYYCAVAQNSAGTAYSSGSPVSFTTQAASTAPSPPTGLVAATAKGRGIQVTWTGSTGATSYNVWRTPPLTSGAPCGSSFSQVASTTATSYKDTAAARGSYFCYYATAVGAGGESTPSNVSGPVRAS